MNIITSIIDYLVTCMANSGIIVGILLIISESIIPALPLSVFIALNVVSYGSVIGILISWISTVLGCMLSFIAFRYFFRDKLDKKLSKKDLKLVNKIMKSINNINFSSLVILISIPFTPAFLINIAAGLSQLTYRKFLASLLIGKFIMVYFWAYIGKSFIESLTDVTVLIKIVILLFLAFILSKIVGKKLKID